MTPSHKKHNKNVSFDEHNLKSLEKNRNIREYYHDSVDNIRNKQNLNQLSEGNIQYGSEKKQ